MTNRRKIRTEPGWTAAAAEMLDILGKTSPDELDAAISRPLADQVMAAVADNTKRHKAAVERAKASPGEYHEVVPDNTARVQMYAHFMRIITGLAEGTVPHCRHISLKAPRPAIAVVFTPSVDCYECARLRPRPVLTEREEHTCDLCRSWAPQQTIHTVMPQLGPFTLLAGICDACRDRLVGAR